MAGASSHCVPDVLVDGLSDRRYRAIDFGNIDEANVMAARRNDCVGRISIDTVLALLPRAVIHLFVKLTRVSEVNVAVGCQRYGKPSVMHAAIRPLRVSGVFKLDTTGHDRCSFGLASRHVRRGGTAVALIGRPRFDFGRQQRVAGPVETITEVQKLIWKEHAVASFASRRVKHKPATEIETVTRWIECRSTVIKGAILIASGIARARIDRNLQAVDRRLVIPRDG